MLRSNPYVLVFAVILGVAVVVADGCDAPSQKQDDLSDLRDWALDDSVPIQERVDTLLAMLTNGREDVEVRATAAQMLGILRVPAARPTMVEALGGMLDAGQDEPPGGNEALMADPSERMRMECVIALGRFAEPVLYRIVFEQMYLERHEPSQLVRRFFVQSFENVPVDGIPTDGSWDLTAEQRERIRALEPYASLLHDVMVTARDRAEDRSIVWRALQELRRITNRRDLDLEDTEDWRQVIEDLRAGIREGAPPPPAPDNGRGADGGDSDDGSDGNDGPDGDGDAD